MKRYERLWERLLTLLGTLGEVEQPSPERLRVTIDKHTVELVLTEKQWDEFVSIPHGSFAFAARDVLGWLLAAVMTDQPYLVYDTYELHPSASPESPLVAERAEEIRRIDELIRANPDAKRGWHAYRPGTEPQ